MVESQLALSDLPSVDLCIRTSGEQRISNFLLWQIAYSELYFAPCLWPDFDESELKKAIVEYQGRQRRFGRVASQVEGSSRVKDSTINRSRIGAIGVSGTLSYTSLEQFKGVLVFVMAIAGWEWAGFAGWRSPGVKAGTPFWWRVLWWQGGCGCLPHSRWVWCCFGVGCFSVL